MTEKIIREYYEHTCDFSGGRNNEVTGYTSVLRFAVPAWPMPLEKLTALFNRAAADFPGIHSHQVRVMHDHLEIDLKSKARGYKKIPGKHMTHDELESRLRSK